MRFLAGSHLRHLFLPLVAMLGSFGSASGSLLQADGPGGGIVTHMARITNGDVFVIAGGSVLRSTDLGQTWTVTSTVPGTSSRLAAGPGNRLYALGAALYETLDGVNWTPLPAAPNPSRDLVVNTAGHLYVTSSSGLHRSVNLGANWTNLHAISTFALAAAPDGTVWYSYGKNVGHVDANGASLPGVLINSGDFSAGVTALAARAGGGAYAATGPNTLPVPSGGGVWRIDPNLSLTHIGLDATNLSCVVARPDDTVFVGSVGYCSQGCSGGGAYRGNSNGGFVRNTPSTAVTAIVDAPAVVLVATRGIDGSTPPPDFQQIAMPPAGVLRSLDDATSWETSGDLLFSRVYSVAANNLGTAFASADWWIYRTTDHGQTWTAMSPLPFWGYEVVAAPAADFVYAWTTGVVHRAAADGSGGWTQHFMPTTAKELIVTAAGSLVAIDWATGQDIMRSTDHGETWTTHNDVFGGFDFTAELAAGRYGRVALSKRGPPTTWLSENDGVSWTPIASVGGPLAFSPDETVLYVAHSTSVVALHEANGWQATPLPATGGFTSLAVDPAGTLYGSSTAGVRRWSPGDLSWTPLGPTVPGAFEGRAGWAPQVIASRTGQIYANTYNAAVWALETGTSDAVFELGSMRLRGYPNPFGEQTTITFDLDRSEAVSLTLFDVRGRRVSSLLDGARLGQGMHRITWRPGRELASGVYLCELRLPSEVRTTRVILR